MKRLLRNSSSLLKQILKMLRFAICSQGPIRKLEKSEAAEAELKAFTQLRAKQDRERREYLQKRISPDQPAAP